MDSREQKYSDFGGLTLIKLQATYAPECTGGYEQ